MSHFNFENVSRASIAALRNFGRLGICLLVISGFVYHSVFTHGLMGHDSFLSERVLFSVSFLCTPGEVLRVATVVVHVW